MDSEFLDGSSEIGGQEIKSFNYEFIPWPAMKKLKRKKITEKNKMIRKLKKMKYKNNRNPT